MYFRLLASMRSDIACRKNWPGYQLFGCTVDFLLNKFTELCIIPAPSLSTLRLSLFLLPYPTQSYLLLRDFPSMHDRRFGPFCTEISPKKLTRAIQGFVRSIQRMRQSALTAVHARSTSLPSVAVPTMNKHAYC